MATVGRFYNVPCIFVPLGFYESEQWIPILGPKHIDAEHIKFHHEHWHVDWRFVDGATFDRCSRFFSGKPHGRVITNDGETYAGKVSLTRLPVMKRRKCKRAMPDFPALPNLRPWVALERAYEGCTLKDNHICPHRGIDLRPFAKADGTAVCPGHGLRWDLTTGRQLPHHTIGAKA